MPGLPEIWVRFGQETVEPQVGLIAQQVQKVLPEIVSEWADQGAEDYLAVDYNRLVAVLIEAVKQQETKIGALQERISTLERGRTSPS